MREIILLGGGGHAKSVLDTLLATQLYKVTGILDPTLKRGDSILGIPVLGGDELLADIYSQGTKEILIGVGSVGNTSHRLRLYEKVKRIGFSLPVIIDPTAVIGRECEFGEGAFIGKGTIINTHVSLGNMVIVNSGAVVEHDCQVGAFCHIAPGAVLCGEVHIGEHSHVGAGSTVIQGVRIGKASLIGAGSVVVSEIGDNKKAFGNPCKEVADL